MGSVETFLWGSLGGGLAYLLVFVLPEFRHMVETGHARVEFNAVLLLGLIGVFVIYVALAGVMAVVVGGADRPGQAVVYGMGWEAVAKGIGSLGAAITAPKVRR